MMSQNVPIAALVFLSFSLLAQKPTGHTTTYSPAKPRPGLIVSPPMVPMPLVLPLFIVGSRFSSTLTLVNNSTAPTYADVTVRSVGGGTIATQRIEFAPHSQRHVEVGGLLPRQSSSATGTGSILVKQSPELAGPAIAATLSITYRGSANTNYIDEEPSMLNMEGSQVLQGVSDRANGPPIVSISSVADKVQHVKVECLGEHGASDARQIELAAGQTVIADGCTGTIADGNEFDAILDRMGESHSPVGVRLTSDAMPGSFAAFALAPHRDSGDRFFSSVLFADPKAINSPNSVFTGVPVGFVTLLPAGNYAPQISVTNFGNTEVHVHTTFARTSGEKAEQWEVGTLTIPPASSRELTLKGLEGDPELQNSFVVHSDAAPGVVMVKLVSLSDSRLHEVELQAKDQLDMDNAGGHPWSITQGTESTLLLFNHSDKPQTFTVSVSGSGTWQKDYKLAPMQTRAVSLRKLIEDQVKDARGKVIPKTLRDGQIRWFVPDPGKGSGRLLQSNVSTAMARNFSCGYSDLLCGVITTIYQSTLIDGEVADFAIIDPVTCTSGSLNDCSGQETGNGGNFAFSWTSAYPNVASVSGNSSGADVNLLGASPGTSDISGRVQSQYCSAFGGGPTTVQQPDHLSVQSDEPNTINCNSAGLAKVRAITYNILDPNNAQILRPVAIFETTDPNTYNSCNGYPLNLSSTCTTTPRPGNFTDTLSVGCPASAQIAAQGCGYTVTDQKWEWCGLSYVSIGDIGSLNVQFNYISVGGNSSGFTPGTTFPH